MNGMENRILLVDDEKDIVELLDAVFRKEGFTNLRRACTGREALEVCRAFRPDLIVLDVMLPDMDGYEVCRRVREFSRCPILFLSSKNDEVDKILGLAVGGDDYVTKPFSPREVVYRVKAQLRRADYQSEPARARPIAVGALSIDPEGCRAAMDGKDMALTAREFQILLYLARNSGRVVSRERLYEAVWGEDSFGCDNTVMVHIRHLREKLEADPANPRYLITVKGLGYKLVEPDGN